jgi:hypothetical protein
MGTALAELKYSEAVVHGTLGRSRIAAAAIGAMALGTLALVAATPGPLALRGFVMLGVACWALESLRAGAWRRGPRAVQAFVVRRSRDIELRMADGHWLGGTLRDGSLVAPWLTIVRFRPHGARMDSTFVILPDMLAAQSFRELRVLLRWA